MINLNVIIKLHQNRIWFNEIVSIEMESSHLPVDEIRFGKVSNIFWLLEQYKQAWRTSHIDQDLVFHVVNHEDANSPMIDGFVKWRHRVGELMI